MRIFLDVGAHHGQTLKAVRDLDFDLIHCFEPVPECWPHLVRAAGEHPVLIHGFGLWGWPDSMADVCNPGTMGAGLWPKDKDKRPAKEVKWQTCSFVNASNWFEQNLRQSDQIFLKLNCEGCECGILNNLLDTHEFDKVTQVMVDFDARKIRGLQSQLVATQERIAGLGNIKTSREAMIGETHEDRIRHWLHMIGEL